MNRKSILSIHDLRFTIYEDEMATRLRERYQKEVAPQIAKDFSIRNPMAIPRVDKIVLNMGMGEAIANSKILDTAVDELRAISGQKPVITKAKKSIASFKLRQGMAIGDGDVAGRPDVRVSRPTGVGCAASCSRLPRRFAESV